MAYNAMRRIDGLTTPAVLRWGAQDFTTDADFDVALHDQVPLRSDVAQTAGMHTRHHTTSIVPPDTILHSLQPMIEGERDDVDAMIESMFVSVLEFAVAPQEQILTASSYQNVGSACINLTRIIANPAALKMEANFAYSSDGDIRFRLRAFGDAGDIDLGGGKNFPLSASFDRVRTQRSAPLPTNNGVLEYIVEARLQPSGSATTCSIRGLVLTFMKEN